MARHGIYKEWLTSENLFLLKSWVRDGATDKEIYEKIGISHETFYKWKKTHTEIAEALKKGKEFADYQVEASLFKNATGFKQKIIKVHKLRKWEFIDGKRFESEVLVEKEEEVYFQPQVSAQIFWLKNRNSSKWKNNPVSNENEQSIELLTQILEETKNNAKKQGD